MIPLKHLSWTKFLPDIHDIGTKIFRKTRIMAIWFPSIKGIVWVSRRNFSLVISRNWDFYTFLVYEWTLLYDIYMYIKLDLATSFYLISFKFYHIYPRIWQLLHAIARFMFITSFLTVVPHFQFITLYAIYWVKTLSGYTISNYWPNSKNVYNNASFTS